MNLDRELRKINNLVLAVLALVPLVFTPFKGSPDFSSTGKVLAITIIGVIYLLILLKNRKNINMFLEWDKINMSLLVYFILLIVSLFSARDIPKALYGSLDRQEGLITIIMYMLIYLTARSMGKNGVIDKRLFKGIVLAASIISIYGIFQYHGIEFFKAVSSGPIQFTRASATMGNPNFLGSYLVLTIPIAMHLFIIEKKNYAIISFGILSYCLLASMTRGSWIGALIAVVLYLIFIRIYYGEYREVLNRVLILIAVIGVVFVIFNIQSDGTFFNRILSITNDAGSMLGDKQEADKGGAGRVFIWRRTIELIKAKPWFGYGIENLGDVFTEIYEQDIFKNFNRKIIVDKAHNEYLNIAVSTGIPSLISYLIFIYFNLKRGVKRLKKETFIIPLMAALIGYLVQAFFNISVVTVSYIFWAFLGLIAGRVNKRKNRDY